MNHTCHCYECATPFLYTEGKPTADCTNCGENPMTTCMDCANPFPPDFLNSVDDLRGRCDECTESHAKIARREKWLSDREYT